MIGILAVAMLQQDVDTFDAKGVFKAAITAVIEDARRLTAQTNRIANARTIYIDAGSYRQAIGLSGDLPADWREIASSVDGRGRIAAKEQIFGCTKMQPRTSCKVLDDGVVLIHVMQVDRREVQGDRSLTLSVAVLWGVPAPANGRPAQDGSRLYSVTFDDSGAGYTLTSVKAVLGH